VQRTEQQGWHQQYQAEHQMREKHQQKVIVLVVLMAEMFGNADRDQVQRIDRQQSEQSQHNGQQTPQTRADDRRYDSGLMTGSARG